MAAQTIVGFWSYVHQDDAADGRIRRLADHIRDEYALITGTQIQVFVDRDHIRWGEEWRRRIDDALAGTTFFIPVITPRYFQSEECRAEFLTFAGHATSLGVQELLLPIIYVDVPALQTDDTADEVALLVKSTQWVDWRSLRFEDERSSAYRLAVNKLTKRLAEINNSLVEAEKSIPSDVASAVEPDQPGPLDLLADAELAMPLLTEAITQATAAMETIGTLSEDATAEMQRSDARGGGASGRLSVIRRLAHALDEPSQQLLHAGSEYATKLVAVDAGVLTLIRQISERDLTEEERQAACTYFASMNQLSASSKATIAILRQFLGSLTTVGAMTRALRTPFGRIEQGVRRFVDGQAVMDEWIRLISDIDLPCGETKHPSR